MKEVDSSTTMVDLAVYQSTKYITSKKNIIFAVTTIII
jgi:hypothetical protein